MAKYYVRDVQGYVTVVEAYDYSPSNNGVFEFVTEVGDAAAAFPMNTTLSVVEAEEAFQGVFLLDEALEETDEPGDPEGCDDCIDCQFEDFLNSEEFITAVAEVAADVVQEYHNPSPADTSAFPPATQDKELPVLKVLKGVLKNGKVAYGFLTPEGFVNYDVDPDSDEECIEMAKEGLSDYLSGERSWHYEEPEDYTFSKIDPPALTVLKATDKEGEVCYGFIAENGRFVNFSAKEYARAGLVTHRGNPATGWNYRNPNDFVFEEVDNG
jgi:hypothetical protein